MMALPSLPLPPDILEAYAKKLSEEFERATMRFTQKRNPQTNDEWFQEQFAMARTSKSKLKKSKNPEGVIIPTQTTNWLLEMLGGRENVVEAIQIELDEICANPIETEVTLIGLIISCGEALGGRYPTSLWMMIHTTKSQLVSYDKGVPINWPGGKYQWENRIMRRAAMCKARGLTEAVLPIVRAHFDILQPDALVQFDSVEKFLLGK